MEFANVELIKDIYHGSKKDLFLRITPVIKTSSSDIASVFYTEMLQRPHAKKFLDHEVVTSRLGASLAKWIDELFEVKSDERILAYIERQREIGAIHARINLPLTLVSEGARIIRREMINRIIADEGFKLNERIDALLLINDLLEFSLNLINHSYFEQNVTSERSVQSLRIVFSSQRLALECERARSQLFDWLRHAVLSLSNGTYNTFQAPGQSDFGQWVNHKLDLYITDTKQINALKEEMAALDNLHREIKEKASLGNDGVTAYFSKVNAKADRISQVINIIVEQIEEAESSQDPLTQVLNRRFMDSILQRMVKTSLLSETSFAVLLLDIDHFKKINDQHGHEAGDEILSGFARELMASVRVNDFIFRYGGEEFLIILPGAGERVAMEKACNIVDAVRSKPMYSAKGPIPVTTSAGVALFDGHPDYKRLISCADQALYKAKETGRDRVVLYKESKG